MRHKNMGNVYTIIIYNYDNNLYFTDFQVVVNSKEFEKLTQNGLQGSHCHGKS